MARVSFGIILLLFTSCSFNKLFLVPYKLSTDKPLRHYSGARKDTTIISFDKASLQPVYTSAGSGDTLKLDFEIESVKFKSANGNTLNGWWVTPKEHANGIILLHFHGNVGNLVYQIGTISPLVKKGYRVFMFDYSGFGFSEGKASKKNVLKDGLAALDFVKSHPYIKNQKLVIYGHSLGGNLAGVIAAKRANDIDAVVIEGAFSSHKGIARDFVKRAAYAGFAGWIFTKKDYNSKTEIKNFHKPVLVIHSREDELIPLRHGKKIFESANEPKEYYEIDKCHICGTAYYSNEIADKIFRLVNENKK